MTDGKTNNLEHFKGKNILGVDFGTKRIGLATFSPGNAPFPVPWGKIENNKDALDAISSVASDEFIDILVVGLPHLTDGQVTDMTEKARQFGNQLGQHLNLPVHFQDETLSSFSAEERMKNSPRYNFKVDKQQVDALAACIILEDFFQVSW